MKNFSVTMTEKDLPDDLMKGNSRFYLYANFNDATDEIVAELLTCLMVIKSSVLDTIQRFQPFIFMETYIHKFRVTCISSYCKSENVYTNFNITISLDKKEIGKIIIQNTELLGVHLDGLHLLLNKEK